VILLALSLSDFGLNVPRIFEKRLNRCGEDDSKSVSSSFCSESFSLWSPSVREETSNALKSGGGGGDRITVPIKEGKEVKLEIKERYCQCNSTL
jgi:hypothetical protein